MKLLIIITIMTASFMSLAECDTDKAVAETLRTVIRKFYDIVPEAKEITDVKVAKVSSNEKSDVFATAALRADGSIIAVGETEIDKASCKLIDKDEEKVMFSFDMTNISIIE